MGSFTYALGQRVTITGTARKVKSWNGFSRGFLTYEEGPLPMRHDYPTAKHFTEGVIVGARTVQDGHAEYDEGAHFSPKTGTARRVWLVAFDMRMKPVMCFDHQVAEVKP